MLDRERERLEYKPNIQLVEHIYTPGQTVVGKEIGTNKEQTSYDNLSAAVKAYNNYNTGTYIQQLVSLRNSVKIESEKIRKKLIQDPVFSGLPKAVKTGDYITLDNYRILADTITGNSDAEIYPILETSITDIDQLLTSVKDYGYSGTIDLNNLGPFIDEQNVERKKVIEAEQKGGFVNYKAISIETQIAKFLSDRFVLLKAFTDDLLETNDSLAFVLPLDTELVSEYYTNMASSCSEDREKMECFLSSNIVIDLVKKTYTMQAKVLKNRALLGSATQSEFMSLLPLAKLSENKLHTYLIDLYKSQLADEMNKSDFISTYRIKDSVRKFYQSKIVAGN